MQACGFVIPPLSALALHWLRAPQTKAMTNLRYNQKS